MAAPKEATSRARELLGLLGFLLVATAQVSNMILARGVAGSVPPFSIAAIDGGVATGDVLALLAMLGWAGYTLLQNRVGSGVGFLARIGLFAAAGALFSLPFAVNEMWSAPSAAFSGRAALVYLFAGLVPGLFAYSAYAWLGAKFGAVSTSLSLYFGPIVSAVLSILFLGEAPTVVHLIGGALSLGGMWLSLQAKQGG